MIDINNENLKHILDDHLFFFSISGENCRGKHKLWLSCRRVSCVLRLKQKPAKNRQNIDLNCGEWFELLRQGNFVNIAIVRSLIQ